MYFIL